MDSARNHLDQVQLYMAELFEWYEEGEAENPTSDYSNYKAMCVNIGSLISTVDEFIGELKESM